MYQLSIRVILRGVFLAICNRKGKFSVAFTFFQRVLFSYSGGSGSTEDDVAFKTKDRVGEKRCHPSLSSDSLRLLQCKMFSVNYIFSILTACRGNIKKKKILSMTVVAHSLSPITPAAGLSKGKVWQRPSASHTTALRPWAPPNPAMSLVLAPSAF